MTVFAYGHFHGRFDKLNDRAYSINILVVEPVETTIVQR